MTTKLEEVLAEEWDASPVKDDVAVAATYDAPLGYDPRTRDIRTAIANLGKRGLALVLKNEHGLDGYCSECGRHLKYEGGHRLDCEWGRIVAEARKLG